MTQPYTPAPIVEVAFGFGPYDEPTGSDWVDITEDVYEVTVQRGRDSEFDSFPASTATVCLYNDDRTYDPLNLSGPYVESLPTGKTPVIVTQNSKSGTSLGSNNSMNMPSGIQAGDLLLAFVSENQGGTSITASSGWTSVGQNQHFAGGTNMRSAVFAKIAVGSDTLSLSGATEDFACIVLRIVQHSVTSISTDIRKSASTNLSGTSFTPASVSIPSGSRDRPYLALVSVGTDTSMTVTPPSAMTEINGVISAPSTCATMYLASQNLSAPTGTSYVSGAFSASSSVAHAVLYNVLIPGPVAPVTLLKPNTPIRIMADLPVDGVFPVWRGVVDAWPGTYSEGGFRNEVEIACTDVFKILSERVLPDTLALDVASNLTYQPYAWFRGDLSPSGQPVDYQKHSKNAMLVTPVQVSESINNGVSPKSFEFSQGQSGSTNRNAEIPVPRGSQLPTSVEDDLFAGTTWAWSALIRADGGAASSATIRLTAAIATTDEQLIYVNVSDTGVVSAFVNGVGANLTATPAPGISSSDRSVNLLDGKLHHVFVLRIATALAVWVDGVFLTNTSNGSATGHFNKTGARIAIGRTTGGSPGFSMSDVMFWPNTTFFTSDIPKLYTALTVGFGAPRLTGEVINDVLDLIDWPASLRAIDEGEQVVNPPGNPVGMSALDLLQRMAESEQGRLFIDCEGKITFHSRDRVLSQSTASTVQYTFSDTQGADVGTQDGSLQVSLDDRFLYDAAKVTRINGAEQTASVVTNPTRTRTLDGLYLSTDEQALAIAEWIVYRYGTPSVRTESWEIDCEVKPEDWADILGLEIGHRIKHDVTPGNIGSSLELEQHVELIEHDITPERWLIKMNGAPVDEGDYFLWDTSQSTSLTNGWDLGVWG